MKKKAGILESLLRKSYYETLTPQEKEDLQIPEEPIQEEQPEQMDEDLDFTDDELDAIVDEFKTEDDIMDAYEDSDFIIIDEDDGTIVEEGFELNEVLSRAQRLRSKVRMMRTKVKRQRRLKIVLKQKAPPSTIAKRARRLAISAMKKKILKKNLGTASFSDKERVEKIMMRRKSMVDRLARKLMPRVRKIEQERLTHRTLTR